MFKTVRRLSEALECLTSATEALRESVVVARDWSASQGNVEARIEELERQRALFEAEVHGELLKAQTEYRKASSAEGRAKTAREQAEGFGDGSEEGSDEFMERYDAWLHSNDGIGKPVGEVLELLPEVAGAEAVVDALKARKRGA